MRHTNWTRESKPSLHLLDARLFYAHLRFLFYLATAIGEPLDKKSGYPHNEPSTQIFFVQAIYKHLDPEASSTQPDEYNRCQ